MTTHHDGPLLVTGASGHLGRRVVELLLTHEERRGRTIVASTRTPDKLADLAARGVEVRAGSFDEPSSLERVFRGVARALIVSTDALDRPGRRFEQHRAAVHAAKASGVEHVVYTSLTNPGPESLVTIAPDHWNTEELIAEVGLGHSILRNNLYAEYLLHHLPHAVKVGKIANAYGSGAVGYVTREDCARAAASALASSFAGRAIHDVTGPAALTQLELAGIVSEVTGKRVEYEAVSGDASIAANVAAGLPRAIAELLVSFELAGAKGQLAVASRAVHDLTGRPPTSVRDFLLANKAALG
ncbi:MAG: SDR family oxidoreductase [Labilithrix sp.]|nr:SDR family oxidoreductase [Labilithrix sp.]MCW5818006.1 SDR family oxidoreductase [Labilithrix sp.]